MADAIRYTPQLVFVPTRAHAAHQADKRVPVPPKERPQFTVRDLTDRHFRHICEEIDFWTVNRGYREFDVKCDVALETVKGWFEKHGYFVEPGGNYGIVVRLDSSSSSAKG